MHLINIVLFLHIFIAIAAFSCALLLHTMQFVLRRATTTGQLRLGVSILHRIDPLFPILALILFGLGAWLIGLDKTGEIKWGDGWVISAVVGLAAMEIAGGAFIAPRSKALHSATEAAADGPIDADLHAKVMDPILWAVTFFETTTALGILFLMPTKPSGVVSAVIVAAMALAGIALGLSLARERTAPAPTQQPAAAA